MCSKAVAANAGTPAHADLILVNDTEVSIRMDLAAKIGSRLGHIDEDLDEALYTKVNKVLDNLVADHFFTVRAIVAEEVKRLTNVPKGVISKLARDAETSVAAPILEHSPLLDDSELIKFITENVREDIAAANEVLHRPFSGRNDLTEPVLQRMAGFVGEAIVEDLIARYPLTPEAQKQLRSAVSIRIDNVDAMAGGDAAGRPSAYRILLVDDDASMRTLIRHIVETFLIADVITADDRDKALALVDDGDHFDLIFCDWMVPTMSGIEFLRLLRERGDKTSFVLLTARKDVDSIVAAQSHGVDAFIAKPVTTDEIQSKLRVLLR